MKEKRQKLAVPPKPTRRANRKLSPEISGEIRRLLKILSEWDGKATPSPPAAFFQSLEDAIVSAAWSMRVKRKPSLHLAVSWFSNKCRKPGVAEHIKEAFIRVVEQSRCMPLTRSEMQKKWGDKETQNLVADLRNAKTDNVRWKELMQPLLEEEEMSGPVPKGGALPNRRFVVARKKTFLVSKNWKGLWWFIRFLLNSGLYDEDMVDQRNMRMRALSLTAKRQKKRRVSARSQKSLSVP